MQPDWDELYQDGIKPWDKGTAAPPLVDWISKNPNRISGSILVPGCGLGHDLRALAENCPDADILGIDISKTALIEAEAIPKVGGESYAQLDLFNLPNSHKGRFDWIWEHTCYCAIDPALRDEYVRAVHEAIKPGGHLLGIFFLNPYDDDHRPGGGPPHGCTVEELRTRFIETGRFEKLEQYIPDISYPGRENVELMLQLKKL